MDIQAFVGSQEKPKNYGHKYYEQNRTAKYGKGFEEVINESEND
jgi:hypothetical protein